MKKYLAFISYRHQKRDQKVSFLLRRYLESFHLPKECPIPRQRKCFRDTDELPTSTDLGADIENALENSEYLIAVCSEEYVKSKWCMREIELYIKKGRKERILPVLVSGNKEVSVPENIRDLPIALDLRDVPQGKIRSRIIDGIPGILSTMSGTEADDIAISERRHRTLALAGMFGGLAVFAFAFIVYALVTAQRIEKNNEQIAAATAEAVAAEEEANNEIQALFLKRAGYLSQKAWLAIRKGDDQEALNTALSALDVYEYDKPDYVDWFPDPPEVIDVIRMALTMPEEQKVSYEYGPSYEEPWWDDEETYEEETEQEEDEIEPLRSAIGAVTDLSGRPFSETTFQGNILQLDTTKEDGEYYYLYYDDYDEYYTIKKKSIDSDLLQQGFTHVFSCPDGSRILYGKNAGMALREKNKKEDAVYRVDGEPFAARRIWTSPENADYIVAFDGERSALFVRDVPEALTTLPAEGEPLCVTFNPVQSTAAVVDSDGRLFLVLTEDGSVVREAEGTWKYAAYADENYKLYAVDADGDFKELNVLSMQTERDFDLPLPLKTVSYCARRNFWLGLADHCSMVIDADTGEVVAHFFEGGDTKACIWEGFDGVSFSHTGNGYMVITSEAVHMHFIEALPGQVYDTHVMLSDPGLPDSCTHAFFSHDGRYAYLQYDNGDLSCWDLHTTDILQWVWESHWVKGPQMYRNSCLSRDGTGIWRPLDTGYGFEKIDAQEGYRLFSLNWTQQFDCAKIREDADGWFAIALGTDSNSQMLMFDARFGDIYWVRDYVGDAVMTQDGMEVLCLEVREASAGERELVFRLLDTEDGRILEEKVLGKLEKEEAGEIVMDQENLTATVDGIWFVDLTSPKMEKAVPDGPRTVFAGEEVRIEERDGRRLLVNAKDGHTVIDAGQQQILVAPDEDEVVLYGNNKTTYVIEALNAYDLIEHAEYRTLPKDDDDIQEEEEDWDWYRNWDEENDW